MSRSVDVVLTRAVDAGLLPHGVVMAADRGGVLTQTAVGPRTVGQADPVTVDTVFRIASMTKIVTTVAALQLVERGLLDLDSPAQRYVPAFGNVRVLDGFENDRPVLRSPRSAATVRQLASHTAGLSYWFWNEQIRRWESVTGTPRPTTGQAGAFTAPMVADPGTRFEYGLSTDWLGRVVEAVSGQSLDAFLEENISGPLGMASTTFRPDARLRARLAPVHRPVDGGWVPTSLDWNQAPDWWSGGHGLYSTPRDYLTFQRALLGGGSIDGHRILRPGTVAQAFTNQIGDLVVPPTLRSADPRSSADVPLGPGHTWGLGLLVTATAQPGLRRAGSGGWSGIYNTHFWVDPAAGLTAALYTQVLPFAAEGPWSVYRQVETALYADR